MSEKIEALVLDAIRFKENSVIAKIFTKDHGLVSILINGLGAKNNKLSHAYLQPLTYIECRLYYKDNRGINKASDLVILNSPFGIVNNIVKSSIAVFIAEIILRTTKDSLKDRGVFDLLLEVVNVLSSEKQSINTLHIYFLSKYIDVLGFTMIIGQTNEYLNGDVNLYAKFSELSKLDQFCHVDMTKNDKKVLLNYFLTSLRSNLGMFDVQSYKILEEVMS